jgi:hypothetical protein
LKLILAARGPAILLVYDSILYSAILRKGQSNLEYSIYYNVYTGLLVPFFLLV